MPKPDNGTPDLFLPRPVVPIARPLEPKARCGAEPRSLDDFISFINRELGNPSPLDLTAERFVDLVNTSGSLRYFFQDLGPAELARLGVARQGYWLRVRPGDAAHLVSVLLLAEFLHRAARSRP